VDLVSLEVDVLPLQAEHLADAQARQEWCRDIDAALGIGLGGGDERRDLLRRQDGFLGLAAHAVDLRHGKRPDAEILGGEVQSGLLGWKAIRG
jgi:hypothetical protein